MASRRCMCRPGTVGRGACLVLFLALGRAAWIALLPSLRLLGKLFNGQQEYDHCTGHSLVGQIVRMGHGAGNTKTELDCNLIMQRGRNSSSDSSADLVLSTLPSRCICAAEPMYGWAATAAGSWSAPVSCGSIGSAFSVAMRRRHCGINKQGRAAWDVEHPPQTHQCSTATVDRTRARQDDIRILFLSSKHHKRLQVLDCTPFGEPTSHTKRSNQSGLPNGGRCYLEPISSLNYLPLEAFDAAIYEAPTLPTLPAYLLDAHGRPTLKPLHTNAVVGVMSLEPSSYYPLASQGCLQQHEVALDLRPSLDSSVPLPYFSWALHPLNLPSVEHSTHTRVRYPKDKVPGEVAPPLAAAQGQQTNVASVVWIASNCGATNWRRKLVSALRRYSHLVYTHKHNHQSCQSVDLILAFLSTCL